MFQIYIQAVGSIGLEFISRGAKKCVFVDNSKEAIDKIKENILKVGELERSRYEIYQKKSDILLKEFTEDNGKYRFDIIYLDHIKKMNQMRYYIYQKIKYQKKTL